MFRRAFAFGLAIGSLGCAACGGGTRAATSDLVAIRQPTPDPTLDAVVRDLPRALAGVIVPTPTPTTVPTAIPKPSVVVLRPVARTATAAPASRQPASIATATPTHVRRSTA